MACIHHWQIESGMKEVEGRCKHCKEKRKFNGGWVDPRDLPAVISKKSKPRHKGLEYSAKAAS